MTENPYSSPETALIEPDSAPRVYLDAEDKLLDNSTAVRFFGSVTIVVGCWFAYSGVYEPLTRALSDQQPLFVHYGAVGVSLIAILYGVIMLVAGRHARKVLMNRWRNATLLNVLCTFTIVGTAIACDHFFRPLLEGLGYVLISMP